jgi:hypothetical protein
MESKEGEQAPRGPGVFRAAGYGPNAGDPPTHDTTVLGQHNEPLKTGTGFFVKVDWKINPCG